MSENKKTTFVHDDRNPLFAERSGHVPPPDVMDYKICSEFRNELCELIKAFFPRSSEWWRDVVVVFQKKILKRRFEKVDERVHECSVLLYSTVLEGEFWEVLSIIEIILRRVGKSSPIDEAIRDLFARKLAPYKIDDSAEPICIIPDSTLEGSGDDVACLKDLNKAGAVSAHQRLRAASEHIKARQYADSVANSVHAVEAIAKEIAGKDGSLSSALDRLRKEKIIDHDDLKEGIKRLYDYASKTARHGQTTEKAAQTTITRHEALLILSICNAIAGYLIRKSGRVKQQDVDDGVQF